MFWFVGEKRGPFSLTNKKIVLFNTNTAQMLGSKLEENKKWREIHVDG